MDLGEIAHLPKPITPHVNFSSFVFNILPLDFSFPRWSVNLAFSTSFFTVLLRAGARRPPSRQWFFYNISCYSSTKFSNLSYLHQRQVLPWNSFLCCSPTLPPAAHNPPVPTSKAPGVLWMQRSCGGLLCTGVEVRDASGGQRAKCLLICGPCWTIWWPSMSRLDTSKQRPLVLNFRECLVQTPQFSDEEAEIIGRNIKGLVHTTVGVRNHASRSTDPIARAWDLLSRPSTTLCSTIPSSSWEKVNSHDLGVRDSGPPDPPLIFSVKEYLGFVHLGSFNSEMGIIILTLTVLFVKREEKGEGWGTNLKASLMSEKLKGITFHTFRKYIRSDHL